jgi:hypothetical protein
MSRSICKSKGAARLQTVFVDTNIIIEAIRTGCWKSLVGSYNIQTVEKVKEEALQGRHDTAGYIVVPATDFDSNVQVHSVTQEQLAVAILHYPDLALLDEGEKHLLACAFSCANMPYILTTADKAAIRASCGLGFEDRLKSLEELARKGTCKRVLKEGYTKKKMDSVKTEYKLELL